LRVEMERSGAFEIRLWIRFSMHDVGGSDEVDDVWPKISGAQANFGKGARGRSDYAKLRGRNQREELLRAGKSDDVGDFFDFAALHPAIFFEMDGGIGLGKKFADRGEAGATVGEVDDIIGIEIVLEGPAGPDASDGGGGVDEDAIHVDEQGFAGDGRHEHIVSEEGFLGIARLRLVSLRTVSSALYTTPIPPPPSFSRMR